MSYCSSDSQPSTSETDTRAAVTTTVYTVTGMTCGHCEQAVGSALSGLDGVTAVSVDVATGLVTVTTGSELDDAHLRHAVDEAGYEFAGRAAHSADH